MENEQETKQKEIIFQVRIDRESGDFELIKKKLDSLEQSGFEVFLASEVL